MMLYGLEAPNIDDFVEESDDGREHLVVRELSDTLEIAVLLPKEAIEAEESVSLDVYCQVAEGVSHFLYLIERVRRGLPTTQLELELQAEVDKYVVVANAESSAGAASASRLRQKLFERIDFLHPEGSERGDRYRLANRLASRFVRRLDAGGSTIALRRFYDAGQREKIEMALAG